MWEMIYPDLQAGFDVNWLIEALTNGTLTGVTEGSYNRASNHSICGAGWILMDINSGQRLAGAFTESSDSVGSYRRELLGLYALNVILLALTKIGSITNTPEITIWCDNEGVVSNAAEGNRRIRSGMSCANILRSLRNINDKLPLLTSYRHVKAHMDNSLTWDQMLLEMRLNCQCDALAKTSVEQAILRNIEGTHYTTEMLPREHTAIFIGKTKNTSDPTKAL